MISSRRRVVKVVPLAVGLLAGIAALSACESQPSTRRVLLDTIEALDVSEGARDCMTSRVEDYSNGQLDDIAEANDDFTLTETGELRSPSTALAEFEAAMRRCVEENPSDLATGGSEPAGSEPAVATTLGR